MTTHASRYCHSGGMLLGAMHPLRSAGDPAAVEDETVACGALACRACGLPVRIWDHFRWKDETPSQPYVLPPDPQEEARDREIAEETRRAYDTGSELQFLVPLELARAYSCRCHRVTLAGGCIDLGDVECTLRWRCSGHGNASELLLVRGAEFKGAP